MKVFFTRAEYEAFLWAIAAHNADAEREQYRGTHPEQSAIPARSNPADWTLDNYEDVLYRLDQQAQVYADAVAKMDRTANRNAVAAAHRAASKLLLLEAN